jgi:hypothetical protein
MADRTQSIIASGLTPEKVAIDRQNAFEIGFEAYVERSGFDQDRANDFRAAAAQGLQEMQNQG